MILPSSPIKILNKSVHGFLRYDRSFKQTNRDYYFPYIDFLNQLKVLKLLLFCDTSPQYRIGMIRAGTTCTVYAFCRTVSLDYPVKGRPITFYATNVAWQDHSDRSSDVFGLNSISPVQTFKLQSVIKKKIR